MIADMHRLEAPLRTVHTAGPQPIAVQLIAAPWRESTLFRVARVLEQAGVCSAPVAQLAA